MRTSAACVLVVLAAAVSTAAAHASSDAASALPPVSWMRSLAAADPTFANRTLFDITLPGTHDSGSYSVSASLCGEPKDLDELLKIANKLHLPVGEVIKSWAKSQDRSLYGQFSGGIRYVDLRSCYNNATNVWQTCHGPVFGGLLQDLLSDIAKFLKDQPGEVLLIEMSARCGAQYGSAEEAKLMKMVESMLGAWLLPHKYDLSETTIGEMVSMDKRLVLTWTGSGSSDPGIRNGGIIANSYADSPVLKTMESYNSKQVSDFQSGKTPGGGRLKKTSWTLTPNTDTVLDMLLPWKPGSLIELANSGNKDLQRWFDALPSSYSYPIWGHILIIDHFEDSPIIKVTAPPAH